MADIFILLSNHNHLQYLILHMVYFIVITKQKVNKYVCNLAKGNSFWFWSFKVVSSRFVIFFAIKNRMNSFVICRFGHLLLYLLLQWEKLSCLKWNWDHSVKKSSNKPFLKSKKLIFSKIFFKWTLHLELKGENIYIMKQI